MRSLLVALLLSIASPAFAGDDDPLTPVEEAEWWIKRAYWDFVHAQQYGRLPCGYWDKENDRLIDPNTPEGRERFLRGEKCYAADYD